MYNKNIIESISLECTIEYEEGNEYVCVLYDPVWDTIEFEGHFGYYDDFEALGLTDDFKKALNQLDDIAQLCNDSMLSPVKIDNITIIFDYEIFEDDLENLGYYKMWKELVDKYGQPQLFSDGVCTLDSIKERYNKMS